MRIRKKFYKSLYPVKKQKFIKSNLTIVIIYFFGALSYLLSLHDIKGAHMKCYFTKRLKCMYILACLTFISSLFISISIYMILFKNNKKIHLFIIFIIYFIFYLIDHNNKVIKHGLFNFIGFLFSTLVLFLIFVLTKIFIFFVKKRKYYIIILILILFGFYYFYFKEYKKNHFFCDKWAFGFNNTFIDNASKDYPCHIFIPQPHTCYLSEIGPYFDFSRIYRPTCLDNKLINHEKNKFLKDLKHINTLKYLKKK